MTKFTATLEELDTELIGPNYKDLVHQITTGTMLVLTFAAGTDHEVIHGVRRALLVSSMRLQGCGKLKSTLKDSSLYMWLRSDHERLAALNAIEIRLSGKPERERA